MSTNRSHVLKETCSFQLYVWPNFSKNNIAQNWSFFFDIKAYTPEFLPWTKRDSNKFVSWECSEILEICHKRSIMKSLSTQFWKKSLYALFRGILEKLLFWIFRKFFREISSVEFILCKWTGLTCTYNYTEIWPRKYVMWVFREFSKVLGKCVWWQRKASNSPAENFKAAFLEISWSSLLKGATGNKVYILQCY